MRAYMSERAGRDERTADAGHFGDLGVAWLAEREARRILAETEPERDAEGWLTAHVPASFPEHGHTELAEALAAFVADEERS